KKRTIEPTSLLKNPNCPLTGLLLLFSDVCSLPVDRGTCAKYTVMWFFNFETKRCSRFWFGGCEGNGNRFKTKIRCQRLCGGS
uniref:BPTI/Kunitz inhibitor domain-containing protein n=1 Tax=Gouania willdenowi TaxID=441366 RepID=A0A8C5DCC2_GOUWI